MTTRGEFKTPVVFPRRQTLGDSVGGKVVQTAEPPPFGHGAVRMRLRPVGLVNFMTSRPTECQVDFRRLRIIFLPRLPTKFAPERLEHVIAADW